MNVKVIYEAFVAVDDERALFGPCRTRCSFRGAEMSIKAKIAEFAQILACGSVLMTVLALALWYGNVHSR